MVAMIEEYKEHTKTKLLVSNTGIVLGRRGKPLSPSINSGGYAYFSFEGTSYFVHRCVYEAFNGIIPKKLQINHIDGCKTNNLLSNLELVTASENQKHAYALGLSKPKSGEKNGMSKLTEQQVIEIYSMIIVGKSNKEIAEQYGVHDRYVSLIRHKKRWKHLIEDNFKGDFKHMSLGNNCLDKTDLPKMLSVIDTICKNNNVNLTEIAHLYGYDASTMSRVKNKKTWKYAWEYYENMATTIEAGTLSETKSANVVE